MSGYSTFLDSVYCEEVFTIDPDELAEVQRLMAEDDGEWAGQLEETERAAMLEQFAFERSQERLSTVTTRHGPMLIKRECTHKGCGYRCNFDLRIGGIAV
ncbi:MAG TPA: hypothetical protein VNO70_05910 [Blastocatellia bacterium]|nr:hypothetical protein [Blastocatellia bacterium]